MRQFGELIDSLQPKAHKAEPAPPKYQLARKRQDNKSLLGYLDLVWKRAAIIKPLWRVGYGSRILNINGRNNAVFVTRIDEVAAVLEVFRAAAEAGELDKAVLMAMKAGKQNS